MNLNQIEGKMKELAVFAVPSNEYDAVKAEEFYKMQKLFWEEKNKEINVAKKNIANKKTNTNDNHHTFINGFGEATKRVITNTTYEKSQKRLDKEIMNFIS